MDVITVESKAFKELEAKINAIADYVLNKQEADNINEDEILNSFNKSVVTLNINSTNVSYNVYISKDNLFITKYKINFKFS